MDVQGILERMDSTPVPALSTEPESRPSQTPEQDATVVDVAPAQLPAARAVRTQPPVLGLVSRLRLRLGLK